MGQYYSTAADEQFISIAKSPSLTPPTLAYGYSLTNQVNIIAQDYFQFAYRYIYDDYQIGVLSPYSLISRNKPTDNYIDITFNSGHKTVIKIQLMRRIGNGVSETAENNTEWYIFQTLDKSIKGYNDNTNYTYTFFGNETLIAVSRIDTDKLFESVPQLADHIEVVESTQIVVGAITEGYDNVVMSIDLNIKYTETRVIFLPNNGSDIFPFTPTEVPLVGDTLYIRFIETGVKYWDIFYELTTVDLVSYPAVLAQKICDYFLPVYGLTGAYTTGPNKITVTPAGGKRVNQISFLPGGTTKKLLTTGNFGGLIINSTPKRLQFKDIIYLGSGFSYNGTNTTITISGNDQPESTLYVRLTFPVFNSQITSNTVLVRILKNGTPVFTYSQVVPGFSSANIAFETPFATGVLGDDFDFDMLCNTGAVTTNGAPPIAQMEIWGRYEGVAFPGLKTNTIVKTAIEYIDDKGRSTGAIPLGQINVLPYLLRAVADTEFYNDGGTVLGFIPNFEVKIKNLAPSYFSKYQLLVAPPSYSYRQVMVQTQTVNADATIVFVIDGFGDFEMTINCRARIADPTNSGSNSGVYNLYLLANATFGISYWDVPILDFVLADRSIHVPANAFYPYPSDRQLVIEIYNPTTLSQPDIYYEIGEVYDILQSNGIYYHQGLSQNQDPLNPSTTPAIVNVKKGDTWYRYRGAGATINDLVGTQTPPYFVESQSITDSHESNFWDKGRINVETPLQRRQKFNVLIRWGGKLIENTQVNDLSVWDSGNRNNGLNQRFGTITGLRQIGYVLKALQQSNISTILLNRNQINNPDGTMQLLVTDRLIGTINPSEEEFGTKHPGSVCVAGSNLYFLDTIKGKVLRDATNGLFPISDFFMKKYWRDKSDLINSDVLYEVISGFDHKFEDYYITVKKPKSGVRLSQNTEETLYFNEGQKLWKYFVDMKTYAGEAQIIDWYGWVGQTLFTFMNGNVWKENALLSGSTPLYLNRFAEQKSLIVETIGMIDDDKVKIFTTHAIHSNIRPTLVELFIPATTMYPNGMYTYLKAGNYSYKEGVFYASIKNDWYTKGVPVNNPAGNLQIAEGRRMRGHVVKVRLTYTTQEYVKLFSTSIGMVPSDKS